uniref:Uncharacterized protein n=1 Tax=Anguilla anguilla TaxID=7936 RepID=A0A0E9W3T3_ANGAN
MTGGLRTLLQTLSVMSMVLDTDSMQLGN